MKEIRYQRSKAANRPSVFERELPRDWKQPTDASPAWWMELIGILIGIAIFMGIPWAAAIVAAALK